MTAPLAWLESLPKSGLVVTKEEPVGDPDTFISTVLAATLVRLPTVPSVQPIRPPTKLVAKLLLLKSGAPVTAVVA